MANGNTITTLYIFLSYLSYFGIRWNVYVKSRKEKETLLILFMPYTLYSTSILIYMILFKDSSWLAPL